MKRLVTAIAMASLMSTTAMAASHAKKETTTPGQTQMKSGEQMKTGEKKVMKSGDHAMDSGTFYTASAKDNFYASSLIGARIYVSEKDVDADNFKKDMEKEWDDIGEIDNLIISREGKVDAVVIGVGGFLGIGEKDVAVKMTALKFVREKDADDADDYFIVVKSSKKELESAPTYTKK